MEKALLLCQTGSVLRSRREVLRLTLAEVSQRCGVTVAQLSRIENGLADPRLSTVVRILEATGASLADIVVTPPAVLSVTEATNRRNLGRVRVEESDMGGSDARARLDRKASLGEDTSADQALLRSR